MTYVVLCRIGYFVLHQLNNPVLYHPDSCICFLEYEMRPFFKKLSTEKTLTNKDTPGI